MGRFSKKEDFHIPFLNNLLFVGLVTIVSMISVRFFLYDYISTILKTPQYTSHQSHDEAKP
jgi:hypothetical protein